MSDSTDNNELDNYGVWVKKPPKDIIPDTDAPDFTDDDFSLDSLDEDLAGFDAIETPDTQKSDEDSFDIPVTEETLDDPFAGVNFETDEASTEEPAAEVSSESDDFSLDDINFDIEESTDTETQTTEDSIEDTPSSAEEPSIDFEITEDAQSSIETETVDINLDEMEDGEIDLDNFLSDDSSSESSSGEETVDLSSFGMDDSSTDSVNLDDFLDGGEFSDLNSTGTGTTQKSDEIVDEDPLDINLSFDESANSFAAAEEESEETIEVPESTGDSIRSTGDDIETESIDLSDFGVDEEHGLQSVKGPEDAIDEIKDESVNYDLKVTVDSDENQTVSMSDVIAGNIGQTAEVQSDSEETSTDTVAAAETDDVTLSSKGQEIISQLMGELASLKSEISSLKSELTDLKSQEPEIKIESDSEENTGFFADGGEDDTIALSGDELSNILSSAEFTEETAEEEEIIDEQTVIEDTIIDEPVVEESIIEDSITEEPVIEETAVSDSVTAESEIEETIPEEPVLDDSVAEETILTDETISVSNGQFAATIDASPFDDSSIFEENTDDIIIEEPSVEETTEEENTISEDLPEEIEIPKVDDLLGDSNIIVSEDSSLTIDTTGIDEEISISPIDEIFEEEPSIASSLTSDKLDYISEDEHNPVEIEEPVDEGLGDLDLPSPSLDDMDSEPESSDMEEPVIEETIIEEPLVEEPVTASVTTPVVESATSNGDIPGDLKQEIKSVLSYMDQLLENLPEDKISEFAQSEQFVTYKKLFEELGLS